MARALARLEELYAIGATRIGGSAEEDAAHELAAAWFEAAGLAVEVDAARNTFGRRGDAEIWTGSHLDSVPDGGKFDGALGVVAALEAVERTEAPLAVVVFRDEERGCAGSRACVESGRLPRAFVELHVEQGPVLERAGAPLGIVTAITGQVWAEVL
jgi:acetylornithine deacetylase/succinyl-diaminopimelate desuccinylase-like protein